MRVIVACFVLLASCLSGYARTHGLVNGTSPNGRFRVQATQRDAGEITYDIVRTGDSAILHRIRSSYQPEEGAGDWPWDESVEAEIHWSDDSRYVVIDEQVHNYIGDVFIISVRPDQADSILLPEHEILARTKLHWERHRIRVDRFGSWPSPHRLSLSLAGQVLLDSLPNGRTTYEHRYFDVELDVDKNRATIIACRDVTKKT